MVQFQNQKKVSAQSITVPWRALNVGSSHVSLGVLSLMADLPQYSKLRYASWIRPKSFPEHLSVASGTTELFFPSSATVVHQLRKRYQPHDNITFFSDER